MKDLLTKTFFAIVLFAISTHSIKSQNKTILITESNLPYTNQTWFYSGLGKALQESEIKKHWDEGRRITSAAYTRNGWFVTMAKGTGIVMQTYNTSSDWPTEWIKKMWDKNYYITSLSRSESHWLVVMSKGAGYTEQAYNRDTPDKLASWIKENWNKGLYITDIAYDGAKWAMVMSKHPKYIDQGIFPATSFEDLQSKMKTNVWNKGYRVQSIESGDGEYFVVYCKYRDYNGRSQQYQVDPSNVNDFIQKIWNQSQNIAYIGGGYPAQPSTPNNPSNENILKFTTFEKTINLTGPEGGDTGLYLKIDYPAGTGEINNKVVNGIKQMIKNSLVGGAIGTSTVGTINTVCNNVVSDYKQGVAKGNLESDGVSYIYCLEKEYHNSQVTCYHITDGIFSNGGPQEAYMVIRLSDGKVLDMADLFSMSYEDGIRLIRQHGTQEDKDALDGGGMGVSSIYISRDDIVWKIVYLVVLYFYSIVRIPSSAIKPYLTAEGGKLFEVTDISAQRTLKGPAIVNGHLAFMGISLGEKATTMRDKLIAMGMEYSGEYAGSQFFVKTVMYGKPAIIEIGIAPQSVHYIWVSDQKQYKLDQAKTRFFELIPKVEAVYGKGKYETNHDDYKKYVIESSKGIVAINLHNADEMDGTSEYYEVVLAITEDN